MILQRFKDFVLVCILVNTLYSCSQNSRLQLHDKNGAIDISYEGKNRLQGLKVGGPAYDGLANVNLISAKAKEDFVTITLTAKGGPIAGPEAFYGSFFDAVPSFDKGVTLWRYKPWNAWTKPITIDAIEAIETWDIQFFYWQYDDGLYAAAMPLSGNGYRTTLGQYDGKFGAKSMSYAPPGQNTDSIPQMVIGFGRKPHTLFGQLFRTGLEMMGKSDNIVQKKLFPEQLDYIGWCTWNASENGKELSEAFVIESVKTFTENDFPLGWVMIDDGWFDHESRMLNSLTPDPKKFPNGFSSLNKRLREEYGIKEVGVWHTLNGYWNGININSELGEKYRDELFSWKTKPWATGADTSKSKTYHFIKPDSDALPEFYRSMYRTLKNQGFSFLKVDNQLVTEQMAPNRYPIFTLSEQMHHALNTSAVAYFDGTVINCMDMTPEAYLNFGTSAVARAVEDYFPADESSGQGYKIPFGNAAVHVLLALYNSLYFQQMVYPDFDMFESYNPDAEFHAVARAINNGPIYITDNPGKQNFDILRKLCFSDGHLIRPSMSLTPTEDCLFQIQQPKAFKAFSKNGEVGLLGVWNMADAETVEGTISPSDVEGIQGEDFIIYEHFSKIHWKMKKVEKLDVMLSRMDTQLFHIIPTTGEAAVIGLIDKYNAPGTVLESTVTQNSLKATIADYGTFGAIVPISPKRVQVDGSIRKFEFKDGLLTVEIAKQGMRSNHTVEVQW